jgi:preprotein translocase subunit Sss1
MSDQPSSMEEGQAFDVLEDNLIVNPSSSSSPSSAATSSSLSAIGPSVNQNKVVSASALTAQPHHRRYRPVAGITLLGIAVIGIIFAVIFTPIYLINNQDETISAQQNSLHSNDSTDNRGENITVPEDESNSDNTTLTIAVTVNPNTSSNATNETIKNESNETLTPTGMCPFTGYSRLSRCCHCLLRTMVLIARYIVLSRCYELESHAHFFCFVFHCGLT